MFCVGKVVPYAHPCSSFLSGAVLLPCLCCHRFSRTAVARVSDDYYPRDPASSTPHIGACAFNSLYLGALVQPDWDMFQSAHPAGQRQHWASSVRQCMMMQVQKASPSRYIDDGLSLNKELQFTDASLRRTFTLAMLGYATSNTTI